ncbi:HAMP domain-containing sensor histidine kinase [Flexivirga caeni]|uniref:Signal transduction histidine-protein kinase/phosphatase MprB n=1 Tax=Flexivirga caeni TaxID=2294115 RepID=A0A3M9M1V3_9MICO|nr:HAMP domain-containing sensor histidine kinase [Flexivirga caeni]RNI19530.1 sensor histidine kinase [Flexivirga caeni]
MTPRARRRWPLYRQLLVLAATIGAITAALAGLLTAGLVRAADQDRARQSFSRLADAAAAGSNLGDNAQASQRRSVRTLAALHVQVITITQTGVLQAHSHPLARVVTPADIRALLDGRPISTTRESGDATVLVQGRPTRAGAIVLLQRQRDAIGAVTGVVWRAVIAFAIALAVAALLAAVVARWMAGPLRRTAQAAHALARGERAVTIEPSGPAEIAEIGDAVETLAASLAETEGRQREFLLAVSHDLRTPLTTLRGYAESLADGVIPAGEVPAIGATMLSESERLTRLVNDLLDLGRADSGELRVELEPTDLTQVVLATGSVWRNACELKGLRLEVDANPGIGAHTDAARVRQVLDNLLDNAVRVAPPGAPIVLALRLEGPEAVLEVRDGGPGLTDDDLAVVFRRGVLHDRYRHTRPVGTGLGLAIVHGVIVALGGRIEAGHAPEGGVAFAIRLPVS